VGWIDAAGSSVECASKAAESGTAVRFGLVLAPCLPGGDAGACSAPASTAKALLEASAATTKLPINVRRMIDPSWLASMMTRC
jgi:hypothetical protein